MLELLSHMFYCPCFRFFEGFAADLKKVKDLPCGEAETFSVKFDPQRAKLKMGNACVLLPIQVKLFSYLLFVNLPTLCAEGEGAWFGRSQAVQLYGCGCALRSPCQPSQCLRAHCNLTAFSVACVR